jgi:hypothetical protein
MASSQTGFSTFSGLAEPRRASAAIEASLFFIQKSKVVIKTKRAPLGSQKLPQR